MPSARDTEVGSEIPELTRVVTPEDVKAYADAGGDQNPLHQVDAERLAYLACTASVDEARIAFRRFAKAAGILAEGDLG